MRPPRLAAGIYVALSVLFGVVLVFGTLGILKGSLGRGQMFVGTTVTHAFVNELPKGSVVGEVSVSIPVLHRSTAKNMWALTGGGVWLTLLLIVLWLLRGLARSVRAGDVFVRSNVRRLRQLGFVFLAGVPLRRFATMISVRTLLMWSRGPFRDPSIRDLFSWEAALAGLCVFVLAQVFAEGIRLREDVEGTV